MENLKQSFYKEVTTIMDKEISISNFGVQKQFEKLTLHLESIMILPRIVNQFELSLNKYKKESGTETKHHLAAIILFINNGIKNY